MLDRDGAALEEWEKTTYKVMNEYVALTMVSMMRGVVTSGTATAAEFAGCSTRRKNRHSKRSHGRLVYRLHTDLCYRRLDGLSREEKDRSETT